MRNLLNFIVKYIHGGLFLLLFCVSVYMIVKGEDFQKSKYLAFMREVTGRVYSVSASLSSYIGLKEENEQLINKIREQELNIIYLKNLVQTEGKFDFKYGGNDSLSAIPYKATTARIIDVNIKGGENFLTLNKGKNDGIEPDMGVFSMRGVVGTIYSVSPHYSVVIPILNSKFQLSCKIKRTNFFGPLVWPGGDPAYANLMDLPQHAVIRRGDTIVTSGYSEIFPEGIPVGRVESINLRNNTSFISLKVKLFTDFASLKDVIIIYNSNRKELLDLERKEKANGN